MARGDHLKVRRSFYSHHGIDVGDGTVVHFSGEPLRMQDAVVCRVPMEEFLRGGVARVVRHAGGCRSAEVVIEEALRHVGQRGYHLWQNNCEHFATYCKTGRKSSRQAARAIAAAGAVLAVGALATGAAVAGAARRRNRMNVAGSRPR